MRVRVARLTLAVTAPRPTAQLVPPRSYEPFLVRRGGDLTLELTDERPPPPRGPLLFDSGGPWRVHQHGDGLLYLFSAPIAQPPIYKAVAIDRELRHGRLYFPRPLAGRQPRWAPAYPLDELLFQHRLALEGSVEVHALGVLAAGRALLFCGHSGAGKSTLARLWRRTRPQDLILSDDRIVLEQRGSVVVAHGTPWHGDSRHASPRSGKLAALFFLRQAPANRVAPLTAADATARLFSRTFPPMWDRVSVARVLDLCATASATVPAFELHFRPDSRAIDVARLATRRRPARGDDGSR